MRLPENFSIAGIFSPRIIKVAICRVCVHVKHLSYEATNAGIRVSPLHNCFKTAWETATRQIADLTALKRTSEYHYARDRK